MTEPILAAIKVIDQLNMQDIPYAVGGSLAGSLHGHARATMDADLIVDMKIEHIGDFISALKNEFYVDELAVQTAIVQKSSFNLIHLDTMFKVDVFIPKRPFDRTQISNSTEKSFQQMPDYKVSVLTAEDTILAKLDWYRLGGEQSERQWTDVTKIVAQQGERLDLTYMRKQAKILNVLDLLERLLTE